MIISLPKWYGEARQELEDCIIKIANDNNINFVFVNDSDVIEHSKSNILNVLVRIKEDVKTDFTDKEIEDMKNEQKI